MTAHSLSRRFVLGALATCVGSSAIAAAPSVALRPMPRGARWRPLTADELVLRSRLPGDVSFALADVRSGEILDARNPVLRQPPASTAKALTALYALDALGPDHRFETRLHGTGPVKDGRLEGDLVLVGGGDPSLDTEGLAALAAALKVAGVEEVAGRFLVHAGPIPLIAQIDPTQPPHVGYNPAVAGINLNYNRVHFEWERNGDGYDVTMDARAAGFSPHVATSRIEIVDRGTPVYTYRRGEGVDQWTVARRALGSEGARWLPVRRPDLYAAEVFQTLARSNGIVLKRAGVVETLPEGQILAIHESAPLSDILTGMLRHSTNLTAEVAGLSATLAHGTAPQTLADSAERMNAWIGKGLDGRQPRLVDHSGLSGKSRIAAADMVNVMVRMGRRQALAGLLKSFPVETEVPISVVAKTGTLNFVCALTGYLTCPDGRELAFAILTSDLDRRGELSRAERERPEGGRAWAQRSRNLQRALLANWGATYGAEAG